MTDNKSIFESYNLIEYLTKSTFVTLLTMSIVGLFPVIMSYVYDSVTVGKLAFIITSVGIIKTFSGFGMSSLLLRTFANKSEEIPLLAPIVIFFATSILLLALAYWFNLEFFNLELVLKLALPLSLVSLFASALQGFSFYNLAHFLRQSIVETTLLCAILFGLTSSPNFNLPDIMNISLLLLTFLGVFCFTLILNSLKASKRKFSYDILSNVKKSSHLFFFSTFYLILSATDQFIILYFLDFAELGYYAVAVGLSAFSAIGIVVVNAFVPGIFAQLKDNIPELNKIAAFSSYMGIWISIVATIFAALFLYFGVEVENKTTVVICYFILVFGKLFHTISGSAGFMCHMTGLEAKSSRVVMVSAIVNLIIGLALVPFIGIIGAAIGTTVALIVNKILLSYVAYNTLGMKSSFLFKYFQSS